MYLILDHDYISSIGPGQGSGTHIRWYDSYLMKVYPLSWTHSSVKQVKLIELCVQDNEGSLSSCVQDLNYIITGIFHIQYKPITYARGEIKFNKKVLGKGTLTWYHLFPTHTSC